MLLGSAALLPLQGFLKNMLACLPKPLNKKSNFQEVVLYPNAELCGNKPLKGIQHENQTDKRNG